MTVQPQALLPRAQDTDQAGWGQRPSQNSTEGGIIQGHSALDHVSDEIFNDLPAPAL